MQRPIRKPLSIPRPPRTDYLTPRLRTKKKVRRQQDKKLEDCIGFTANLVSMDEDYEDVEEI
jgi:hypothetical protein